MFAKGYGREFLNDVGETYVSLKRLRPSLT